MWPIRSVLPVFVFFFMLLEIQDGDQIVYEGLCFAPWNEVRA